MKPTQLLAIAALPIAIMASQAQPDVTRILRAAASALAADIIRKPISVDPRIFSPSPTIAFPRGSLPTHPADRLAALAAPGSISVAPLEMALACDAIAKDECRTNGTAAFAMFSVPRITGDSAVVDVFFRGARQLTAKDSAEARATGRMDAALRYMSRPGAAEYRAWLVRSGTEWRVVKWETIGIG